MPELPEVETIRRGLLDPLVGRSIIDIDIRSSKQFNGSPTLILHTDITDISRRGKLLIIHFSNNFFLTIHLKMTGQLIWRSEVVPEEGDIEEEIDAVMGGHPEKSYLDPLPHKHTHIIITFDDESKLYFNDLRKFGYMAVATAEELGENSFVQTLGPEPLEADFTRGYLKEQLARRPRSIIKSFLLDQTNIAGLGNIYADESLFRAAILPNRQAGSLTGGEVNNLFDAIQETLEIALLHGGSSSKDYVNAVGDKGTFLAVANVYHRTGQGCNRCHTGEIERIKIGGRSTHFCPICQY